MFCVLQNLVKENLKNKQRKEDTKKADSAADVVKVKPKVESKNRGEKACHFLIIIQHTEMNVIFVSEVKSFSCFPVLYSGQLMKAEEKGSGAVAWPVYKAYIKAAGGPVVFIINALFFLSTTGSIAFSNWWLSYWIRQGSGVSWEKILLQYNGRLLFSVRAAPKRKITTSLQ